MAPLISITSMAAIRRSLLAQHIVSVWREDAVDGLDVVRSMTVDVHIAVIGHGIVALEPQLNGVHVELSLFEVVNLLHARRVLRGVGYQKATGTDSPDSISSSISSQHS